MPALLGLIEPESSIISKLFEEGGSEGGEGRGGKGGGGFGGGRDRRETVEGK